MTIERLARSGAVSYRASPLDLDTGTHATYTDLFHLRCRGPVPEKRVLIVDEPEAVASYVEAFRTSAGAEVLTAADRQAALELIDSAGTDLLILDFTSRLADRSATYFDLLDTPVHHATPCLFLTDRTNLGSAEKLLRRPMDRIMIRPFSGGELAQRAREMLQLPQRKALQLLVRLYLADSDNPFPIRAKTQNISAGGMFVLTQQSLDLGQPLRIVFRPAGSDDPLELEGVVRRKETMGQDMGYGLEFQRWLAGDVRAFARAYGVDLAVSGEPA